MVYQVNPPPHVGGYGRLRVPINECVFSASDGDAVSTATKNGFGEAKPVCKS